MTIMTLAERKLYLKLSVKLSEILITSHSQAEYMERSQKYISDLFDDVDIPTNVYYKLCKLRAELSEITEYR